MGSGSSKKSTKEEKPNTDMRKISDTSKTEEKTQENKKSEPTVETKKAAVLTSSLIVARGIQALQHRTSKVEQQNDWQDKDVSELFASLSISDSSDTWLDHCDELMSPYDSKLDVEKTRTGWKTVRLFVSSTFKDMMNEREHLVKKVFPELRQWCEDRRLRLVECDLRWGVPKDSDTRETLLACLSEIDRCREENVYPYFLNLMSERYGWAPQPEEVPEDIKAKYKWMPGMSATAAEIMIGGYWDRNTKALYLLRNPDFLSSVTDEKALSYYKEKTEEKQQFLARLKGKLKEKFPSQVFEYNCKFEKEENGVVYLGGLEAMGERVLKHFKKQIDLQYPQTNLGTVPSLSDVLRQEHEVFVYQRSQVLLGRELAVENVNKYILDDKSPIKDVPMVMVGSPGSGKSALLAYVVKMCLDKQKYKVFYHFIGATPRSTDLYQILGRFFMEHMPAGNKMPEDLAEMKRFSETMFLSSNEKYQKMGFEKFVIFIDALNQMDDEGDAQYLGWLPNILPKGMKLIVSTLEGKSLNSLRGHKKKPLELEVNPLEIPLRQNIAESLLAEYNKKLDPEQMEILINKSEAGRPLWLTKACEELRVFGEFRKLTDKIKSLPDDIIGLLEMILKRIETEYGNELVVAMLCLVETSRFGLLETELLELLTISPTIPGGQSSQVEVIDGKLSRTKWALLYLGLRSFLRPCGSSGEGRLDFHHRTMSKVVRKMYLATKESRIKWHQRLVEYFQNCKDIERKAEELPYHEQMSEDKDLLKTTLLSREMFEVLYKEENRQQLMKYWQFLGGYKMAAEAYKHSLERYIKEERLEDIDDIEPIQMKISWFLVDIGEYEIAQKLLEEVIAMVTKKHGEKAKQMADALFAMVFMLYRKALKFVYGSHPGYKECRRLGTKYCDTCAQVHKKHSSANQQQVGHVLTVCGYFNSSYLMEAKSIFEKFEDKQGLAEVLYMLGEKNQYNTDMNIPIELFKRSMALCMNTYGRFHIHTARCCQLYGQMYWNQWTHNNHRKDWMEACLPLYQQELEILEEILGLTHVTTNRSREDVIIILQTLGRDAEAAEVGKNQPKDHEAL